jgi:hypothetical protein
MKNKITKALEQINPDTDAKQRVWSKAVAKKRDKRSVIPMISATAAVFAVIFLVYFFVPAQASNSFTAVAYVPGHRGDGTHERIELDIHAVQQINGDEEWLEASLRTSLSVLKQGLSGDDRYIYFNIAFDITGENIDRVELSLNTSFFAKQRIDHNNVLLSVRDDSGSIIDLMFGTDFKILGNRIDLEDMKSEDYSFAIAIPIPTLFIDTPMGQFNYQFNIHTQWAWIDVTFEDGEKQSRGMSFHLKEDIGGAFFHRDYGTLSANWLALIDLTEAALIPESVQVLSLYDDPDGRWSEGMYIWEREQGDIFASRLIFSSHDPSSGFSLIDEQRYEPYFTDDKVILPVIRLDENGDLIAMEYILSGAAEKYFLDFWK